MSWDDDEDFDWRDAYDEPEGFCSSCNRHVRAIWIDESFDHAFGTEHTGHWECAECEGPVEKVKS